MSDCPQAAAQGEDQISPSVSDEKMDTASESFPSSQHTPNTPSDLDDKVMGPNNPYPRDTPTSPCQETLDSCYDPIDSYVGSDNAFVVNTGVLRLAHPVECLNDNDSYRNSDVYDVDNITGDTVSPLCEDSSSIVSLKGSSEYSKSSEYTRHLDNANNVKRDVENLEYQKSDSKNPRSNTGDTHRLDNTSVPLRLGNPRLTSTLTLTDDHPLMGLSSPESPPSAGNYPDLILPSRKSNRDDPKNGARVNDPGNFLNSDYSGVMSLSSTEDESFNKSLMNGDASSLYSEGFSQQDGPQRNTSKNNLYFTDNFTSSDGNRSVEGSASSDDPRNYSTIVDGKLSVAKGNIKMSVQPDILDSRKRNTNICSARSENGDYQNIKYNVPSNTRPDVAGRKKVKADIKAPKIRGGNLPKFNTEQMPHQVLGRMIVPRSNVNSRTEANKVDVEKKVDNLNYPLSLEFSNVSLHDYVSEVAEFPNSPSELRTSLNYELPIEPVSSFPASDDVSSDSSSESHDENERSLYCTEVDPFGGKVSLKPRVQGPPPNLPTRRRIKPLISEADTDSVTALNAEWLPGQRRSWSGSGSSVDSLCGYSIRSEEGDGIGNAEGDGDIMPDCNTTNTAWSEDRSQEGEEEEDDEEDEDGTPEKIPEYSLNEERNESRRWLKVTLPAGEKRSIDMKVIEPYKRVLSHGGYALSGRRDAIVVFSACFLPDSSRVDYNYVMDNLFLYVLTTMEQLVTDDYILVYLHGSASKRSMPTFHWLKKCYQLIDRRLRKSLKHLYLVHPTFWLKSIMWMTRPFISSKFSRKLTYIHSLDELSALVPVEPASIPERVRQFEAART